MQYLKKMAYSNFNFTTTIASVFSVTLILIVMMFESSGTVGKSLESAVD